MNDLIADRSKIAIPVPTPETADFWAGTKVNELRLQRCDDCRHVYFPPRPFCPACACRSVSTQLASGCASLYSYVINHRPHPGYNGPYAIAVVTLEEGPRMMTNILNSPQTPKALVLDMPLRVTFESLTDEITLPYFQPTEAHKCDQEQ